MIKKGTKEKVSLRVRKWLPIFLNNKISEDWIYQTTKKVKVDPKKKKEKRLRWFKKKNEE